ncbi:MAG: ATP-binding cassette domain-containing protein, partial [Opitutales bacterium]|nr:ATP-binding cassette domain-containing protein [Opitutales bacterium]
LLSKMSAAHSPEEQSEFDALVHEMNANEFWKYEAKITETLDKLELQADMDVAKFSAGLKRRVLLGRELVQDPDALILDEPTNHLDIESVIWLEKFLKQCGKTLVFVSHDRMFLQNLATRVTEIDRAKLISFDCGFKTFLKRRDELLDAIAKNEEIFDKKLAQEEAWLRQGVKARRTRNEGRVRELMRLRKIRQSRRERQGSVTLKIQDADASGQKVMEVENIGVNFGGRDIIKNFSTTIYRGDKIGIIGRNGVGKTTLLNALLGKIKLSEGSVNFGARLKIAYFDQLRETLDPKRTIFDYIGEGSDYISVGGQSQSVMGYLRNFLFAAEQIHGEIGMLSGGEKNRLLLAKLFSSPANVLVLDEPTNDLDMQTIEILENTLVEFKGTILLVSHDRQFLNNIAAAVFGFEEDGKITEIVGGYDEWFKYLSQKNAANNKAAQTALKEKPQPQKREKFTNKERKELEEMQGKIEALESEQEELSAKLQDVEFIRQNVEKLSARNARLEEIQNQINELIERWSYLEERKNSLEKQA